MKRSSAGYRLFADIGFRLTGWPRRALAIGCLVLAAVSAVSGHRHGDGPTHQVSVAVAAHSLAAGVRVSSADVRIARWPAGAVPDAAARTGAGVVGAMLAGAMTAGEPFTPARLQGRGLAAGLPTGQVAMSVSLADPGGGQLFQAGDTVDLIVGSGSSQVDSSTPIAGRLLAAGIRVLAVLPTPSGASGSDSAGLVVATDTAGSLRIAGAAGAAIVATLRAPP